MYDKAFLVPIYGFAALTVCSLYALFLKRLEDRVQPIREAIVEEGTTLLAQETLSVREEKIIKMGMQTYRDFLPMVILAVVSPFALITIHLGRLLFSRPRKSSSRNPKIRDFQKKLIVSWMAANPLFAFVAVIEALLYAILNVLFFKSRSLFSEPVAESVTSTENTIYFFSGITSSFKTRSC